MTGRQRTGGADDRATLFPGTPVPAGGASRQQPSPGTCDETSGYATDAYLWCGRFRGRMLAWSMVLPRKLLAEHLYAITNKHVLAVRCGRPAEVRTRSTGPSDLP